MKTETHKSECVFVIRSFMDQSFCTGSVPANQIAFDTLPVLCRETTTEVSEGFFFFFLKHISLNVHTREQIWHAASLPGVLGLDCPCGFSGFP